MIKLTEIHCVFKQELDSQRKCFYISCRKALSKLAMHNAQNGFFIHLTVHLFITKHIFIYRITKPLLTIFDVANIRYLTYLRRKHMLFYVIQQGDEKSDNIQADITFESTDYRTIILLILQ